jgi:hypothetical protein
MKVTFAGMSASPMDDVKVAVPVALLEVEPLPGRESAAGERVRDASSLAGGEGQAAAGEGAGAAIWSPA